MTEKLANATLRLAASRAEGANSRLNTCSIANGASEVEDNVDIDLMAVSAEDADATKRKVSIIALEAKDASK